MAKKSNPIGDIKVSRRAIATIAHQAALESYGVVGLASKNIVNGLANYIVRDPTHGIDIRQDEETIHIDLYVIVEYGTNIKAVAASLAHTVRFHVEKAIGLPIGDVNVHVQGLRISDED
jgi:uncharacterized alkaline shock family protein YloU